MLGAVLGVSQLVHGVYNQTSWAPIALAALGLAVALAVAALKAADRQRAQQAASAPVVAGPGARRCDFRPRKREPLAAVRRGASRCSRGRLPGVGAGDAPVVDRVGRRARGRSVHTGTDALKLRPVTVPPHPDERPAGLPERTGRLPARRVVALPRLGRAPRVQGVGGYRGDGIGRRGDPARPRAYVPVAQLAGHASRRGAVSVVVVPKRRSRAFALLRDLRRQLNFSRRWQQAGLASRAAHSRPPVPDGQPGPHLASSPELQPHESKTAFRCQLG